MNEATYCLRCEQGCSASAFNIAERVCDSCVADREYERRVRLNNFHPDLDLELASDEEPLHVKNKAALAIVKRILEARGVKFGEPQP